MLMHEFLQSSALKHPSKIAIKSDGETIDYSQLNDRANQLADYLVTSGLAKGDRVVIYMGNTIRTCIAIYAVLKAGGVFVMVNPSVPPPKLSFILSDSEAKAIITQDVTIFNHESFATLRGIEIIATDCESEKRFLKTPDLSEILSDHSKEQPAVRIIDSELASLIYTSGSTGNPKGVMMTHLNMVSALSSIVSYLENTSDDVVLNVLPLSFDYGLYQLLMTIAFGGTLILEKGFIYPNELVTKLIEEKITGFPGVPTVFAMLFRMTKLRSYDFPYLRYITNTGAALPVEFIHKLRKAFPTSKIYSMYGLTECKRVAFLPPSEIDKRPKSVGKAMPNCEVYIVDDNGKEVKKPGEIGELVVRGTNIMQGYWNRPNETSEIIREGKYPYERVLYTGDLFYQDKEGYLYFVARKDDIIKSRGEKVSPKEIENVLCKLDGISEAAVIGVCDEILGQTIRAAVVLQDGKSLSKNEILSHCKKYLENFAIPQYIDIKDELPRNSNGKIDIKRLIKEAKDAKT